MRRRSATTATSTTTTRALTATYLGLAAADSWLAGSSSVRAHRVRRITKPLLMPTLAAALATDPRARRSPLRTSTLVAQAFGWGGDVALLRGSTEAFAVGAGSFGVGHLAYTAGFRSHRDRSRRLRDEPTARTAAALFVLGGPAMALGAARTEPALGTAVLGYTAVLATMLAHAAHLEPALPARARLLSTVGAATFAASDSVLGVKKFWSADPPPRLESAVMATYTLGQLLLSRGAAAAAR